MLNWQQVIIHCLPAVEKRIMKSSVECYHIIFVCLSVLNRDLHLCFGISEVRSSCSTGITIGDMEKIVWSHLMLDRAPHDIIPKSSYPGIKSSLIIVLKLSFEVEREREREVRKKYRHGISIKQIGWPNPSSFAFLLVSSVLSVKTEESQDE